MKERSKHDDPLAGLLARSLAESARDGKDCPDAEILAAYFERSLAPDESTRWELHFSTCGRCQEHLAAMARMEPATAVPEQPAAGASVWFLNWRWLAPAAAALGVFTLWVVMRTPEVEAPQRLPVATVADNRAKAPEEPAGPTDSAAAAKDQTAKVAAAQNKAVDRLFAGAETETKPVGTVTRATPATPQEAHEFGALPSRAPAALPAGGAGPVRQSADEKAADFEKRQVTAEKEKEEKARAAESIAEFAVAQKPATQQPAAALAAKDDKPAQQAQSNVAQSNVAQLAQAQEADRNALSNEAQNRANVANAAPPKLNAPQPSGTGYFRKKEEDSGRKASTRDDSSPFRTAEVAGSTILWRVGRAGSIERSLDSGTNWQKQASGISADLLAASAPSANVCWVVGRGGVVLRTTDGKTWMQAGSPASADLVSVEATDANQAIVTTSAGKRYQTADGGRTWRSL